MSYNVLLSSEARNYLDVLDEKSEQIHKDNLAKLADEPYPGRGSGDKEGIIVDGEEMFRMHISRTHTAFYLILEEEQEAHSVEVLPVDETHKRCGF